MKQILAIFLALSLLTLGSAVADAGAGPGKGSKARHFSPGGAASSCVLDIYTSEPVIIVGTVEGVGVPGAGLLINTGDQSEPVIKTVYGTGPTWYWQANQIDKPEIGETVSVVGYSVAFPTGVKVIAQSVTVGDLTIELRATDTGCPLWR